MLKENITFTYLVDSHALKDKVLVRKNAKAFSRFVSLERNVLTVTRGCCLHIKYIVAKLLISLPPK